MNNILVIGANGFIGQNICRKLINDGYNVFAADLTNKSQHNFNHVYARLDVIHDSYDTLVNQADCVIYLVSTLLPQPSNQHVIRDINENLIPVISLMESVRLSERCNKIIFASSGGTIYGVHDEKLAEDSFLDPKCSYGIMKLAVEKYLHLYRQMYGIQTVSLRLSNPYGIGQNFNRPQGAVGVFLHNMLNHAPVEIWGDGSVTRDYIYIDDVAAAFSAAVSYTGESEVFNIGMGVGTSLNELLELLFKLTNSDSTVIYTKSRSVDVPLNILNIDKARKELGWQPSVNLHEGLTKLIELIKNT